ncbi:MAG: hypothetical protein ABI697_07500 [Devosia sp.]
MTDDTVVQTRPLGEQERLFHYLHALGGLVASGAAHIRGPLTPELVARAFAWLQHQHPVLNSHIRYEGYALQSTPPFFYPIPWFDTRGTTSVPIRVVTDPNPDAWKAVLAEENKTPIGRGTHPRYRIVLVRTHDGADLTHLVTTLDHCIADAQAGSMMNDQLFRYFADPEAMEGQPLVQVGLPPALESGLTKKSDNGKSYQRAIRFPLTNVPNPARESRSIHRLIGVQVSGALRDALRTHRTTMHGAVGAAFLAAAREKFGIDEMTILSTVELRRMMKPPLPITAFGCYIDILRTHHQVTDDFWAMAADLSFKLISAIARDQISASVMKTATWEMIRKEAIPTMKNRRRIDGIAITTAGASNFRPDFGPFKVEGMSESVSLDMFGPSLFVVTGEQHGQVDLFVGYAADVLSDDDANDIADRAVAALTAAAEPVALKVAARRAT